MPLTTEYAPPIALGSIPTFSVRVFPGETIESMRHTTFVLDCISSLFQTHIPSIGSMPLTIENRPDADTPVCYRAIHLITLCTEASRWSQISYQYAHELCHYAIPQEVDDNLRWLEESICELASLYFLRAISVLWKSKCPHIKTADGQPYWLSFGQYADNVEGKYELTDFRNPETIAKLEKDCYNRPKNMYLAKLMLPIFIRQPETWKAIPYLCKIHRTTLSECLDTWIHESPQPSRPGLQEIRKLFL